MIKVLSVASECAPLVKTGGLADVVGALPPALAPLDVEVRTLLPGYPGIMAAISGARTVGTIARCFGGSARIVSGRVGDLRLFVLDAPHLFEREHGIYLDASGRDWPDNPERYAALCQSANLVAEGSAGTWRPKILHAHDWQGGLAPYYAKSSGADVGTVLTIHNIAFQGLAPASKRKKLRIAAKDFRLGEGVEYWGKISALKAGIVYADKITTVSPRYTEELLTPEFGMGLEGVLHARQRDLSGIVNGIDETVWSPATDPALVRNYKAPGGKAQNKRALQEEFGLGDAPGPLCVVVSRLTEQKGLDLLLQALPVLTARGGQLALLGSGDAALERAFQDAALQENVAVKIGYDEALSHRMMAGGDAVLVPSRFEPCGLTQLYGLRYGTLPLVALTGGLADTVIPATPATLARQVATGVQFFPVTTGALATALDRLCDLYDDPKTWSKMQRNAMAQPVGWDQSAERYAELYRGLLSGTA